MSASRVPKWVWYLCATGSLVGLVLFLFRDHSGEMPKPKSFVSIYGERVTYADEQVVWITGRPAIYSVVVPVSTTSDNEQRIRQADELFTYYVGPHADDLGFRRVLIRPDDGSRPGEVNILGFRFAFRVSIGTGPLTEQDFEDGIVYEKQSDDSWSRGGFKPEAPSHIQEIGLPTGAKFALTYSIEDFPSGWFVYDCLACTPTDGYAVVGANLFPLLMSASKLAERDHLSKASIAIFAGARKSTWQFPAVLHTKMILEKHQWTSPKLTPEQVVKAFAQYLKKMKVHGAALRHEKP